MGMLEVGFGVCMAVSGVPQLLAAPLLGLIIERTADENLLERAYNVVFVVAGAFGIFGSVILAGIRYFSHTNTERA